MRPLIFLWERRGEIRHYRWQLIFLSLLAVGLSSQSLITPQLTRHIIDVAYPARNLRLFWIISGIMVAVNIASAVIHGVHGYLSTYINNIIGFRIRMRVFQALSHLPVAYVERHNTGMFLERCSNDSDVTAEMLANIVPQIASLMLTTGITIALMLKISIKVTALIMACVPIYSVISIILATKLRRWEKQMRQKAEELSTLTVEAIQGVPTAKVFGAQKWLRANYKKLLRDKIAIVFGIWRTQLTYGRLGWAVTYGWGVVLTCGVWYLVFKDRLLLGESVALGMYIPLLLRPADAAISIYKSLMSSSVSAQRIDEVIKAAAEHKVRSTHANLATLNKLQMRKVSFAYPDRPPCLQNISLDLKRGETVVIMGHTGSGKTTLLRLLAGMYDCTEGRIIVDGHDLSEINLDDYQAKVAMVMPENFFFSWTLLENMLIAAPDADEKKVRHIAEVLGIDKWIQALPDGYNSRFGAEGVRLSSGQMQKVALMRALLKKPRLLLLDEVTSAMDIESERQILDGLNALCPAECVTVMTTHRLRITMEPWIDRIVVLSNGRIIENGSAPDLYTYKGEYRRLMELSGLDLGGSKDDTESRLLNLYSGT